MPHRYFTTEISDGTATLRGADAHHLARVMRARLGDTVILCDGNAVEYTATITGFGDECVEFRVEPGYPSAAEPSVEVTLLAGYPKQDKLEQIIKHGVELGAAHIVPFFSRYCVAAPKKEEQKNERYNRIAFEAAKQCGRGILPDVALPLANFGAVCRTFAQYDLVLFCYECGGAPLRDLLAAAKPADGEKLKIAIVTGRACFGNDPDGESGITKKQLRCSCFFVIFRVYVSASSRAFFTFKRFCGLTEKLRRPSCKYCTVLAWLPTARPQMVTGTLRTFAASITMVMSFFMALLAGR